MAESLKLCTDTVGLSLGHHTLYIVAVTRLCLHLGTLDCVHSYCSEKTDQEKQVERKGIDAYSVKSSVIEQACVITGANGTRHREEVPLTGCGCKAFGRLDEPQLEEYCTEISLRYAEPDTTTLYEQH